MYFYFYVSTIKAHLGPPVGDPGGGLLASKTLLLNKVMLILYKMDVYFFFVGWFERIPTDGQLPCHYDSIGAIAKSGYPFFLTKTLMCAFIVKEKDDDIQILGEKTIYPGEVLKMLKVCKKTWKTKTNVGGKRDPEDENVMPLPETHFLKCTDLKKNELCLPLAHPGKFSVIAQDDVNNINQVYQVWKLLEHHSLPQVVRVAFGWAPKMNRGLPGDVFSGYLRLVESYRPDTLILYNYSDFGNVMVELPMDADVRLQRATNQIDLDKSEAFTKSLQYCQKMVFPFAISMKALQVKCERQSESEENTSSKGIASNLMANPRDMDTFSRSDVYPSLETDDVSDTWSFSFHDPEHMYDKNAVHVESLGESEDSNPKHSTSDHRRESTAGYIPETVNLDNMVRNSDARASRIQEINQREAKC